MFRFLRVALPGGWSSLHDRSHLARQKRTLDRNWGTLEQSRLAETKLSRAGQVHVTLLQKIQKLTRKQRSSPLKIGYSLYRPHLSHAGSINPIHS
jgi:hypothetical protein